MRTVVVFGGTGFLGRRLVHRLAADGTAVRVAVRHPSGGLSALRAADLDQVMLVRADVRDQASVAAALEGDSTDSRFRELVASGLLQTVALSQSSDTLTRAVQKILTSKG